ncbi:MAG: GTP cyclohydrolase FolE2 [Pseudomonadota bacterium]
MPDIAADGPPEVVGRLGWVGMQDIEAPVNLAVEGGVAPQASARVTAFVNLVRPEARGIHMSRLYLHVDQLLSHEPLTPGLMMQLLDEFMRSHDDLSDGAYVRVDFDYLVRRSALRSDNSGWRRYPVHVAATRLRGQTRLEIGARIVYSSTCPCSAALARQIIQQNFERDFEGPNAPSFEDVRAWLGTERAISATPHSQRSHADLRVVIDEGNDLFPLLDLIDQVENALATPVQAAVKREDEQAFAQLNGENLMFCEDAARRIQHALNGDPRFVDFWARASHRESLHPHDAVAVACKGIPGGFTP